VPIVSITKTALTPLVTEGGTAIFEVVARNSGAVDADGSVVTDAVPAGLTGFDSWICEAEGGAVCPTDSSSGALNETIEMFPAGSLLRWTISATVASGAPEAIENTASIDPPDDGICSDGSTGPCDAVALIETQEAPQAATSTPSTMTPDRSDDATATPTRTATPTPTATTTPPPTGTPAAGEQVAGITPPSTGDGGLRPDSGAGYYLNATLEDAD
jgi:uncharacterized repeat protein (TIGR01451 family)